MKIAELTYDQLLIIASSRPVWMAYNRTEGMAYNRPDWVAKFRPDWMAKFRPEYPKYMADCRCDEVPDDIVALIK